MKTTSPTDILRKEHDKVLGVLDDLEKGIGARDIPSLKKGIALLEREFDRHSLRKEEEALFPEIEKFIPREGGPTGMMVMEHRELVGLIKSFKQHLKTGDVGKLGDTGGRIFSILRPHISKENDILFMIADMHLDDRQKKAILEKFKEFDAAGRG